MERGSVRRRPHTRSDVGFLGSVGAWPNSRLENDTRNFLRANAATSSGDSGPLEYRGLGKRLENCLALGQRLSDTHEEAQTAMGANSKQGWCMFGLDRKSTRLNSSHLGISYAVFCLKKKNKRKQKK